MPPAGDLVGPAAVLALGTYAFRLGGPLLARRLDTPRARAAIDRAAVVVLFAVALTAVFYDGRHPGGLARPVGVAVGVALAARRLPLVVVAVSAAAATALLRLAGVA